MQSGLPPRLQIAPPFVPSGQNMLPSPGGPFFSSPASYIPSPFGGSGAPPAAGATDGYQGYFPGGRQGAYGPNMGYGGLGMSAPSMALGMSQGSEAPSMMRSSSTSSYSSTSSAIPSTPANFGSYFSPQVQPSPQLFSPPLGSGPSSASFTPSPPQARAPPVRSKLHASTPSFHPGSSSAPFQRRQPAQSISLRPGQQLPLALRSPTLGRARSDSASPAPSSVGIGTRPDDDVKKRKKVVVRVPRERDEEDDVADGGKEGRKQSVIRRNPLSVEEKRERMELMERDARGGAMLEEDELVGRAQHYDEVKMSGLPPSIDVYLPGKDAWVEVWEGFVDETTSKWGYFDLRKPDFLAPTSPTTARHSPTSFLRFDSSFPPSPHSASPLPNLSPHTHNRTHSLFTPPVALPARLQNVLDNLSIRRPGHASSMSLGGAALMQPRSPGLGTPGERKLTPFAKSFTMPGWTGLKAKAQGTPLPESPVEEVEEEEATEAKEAKEAKEEEIKEENKEEEAKPSLAELARGFGLEDDDEGGLVMDDEVVKQEENKVELPEEDEVDDEDTRSTPSRRMSGVSTRTDHTGVASLSDAFSASIKDGDDEQDGHAAARHEHDIVTNPSDEDKITPEERTSYSLNAELSRALTDLGPLDSSPPRAPPPAIHVEHDHDVGYDGSDDSEYADAELSEGEYSNPSEEDKARERAIFRARSSRALREEALRHQPPNFGEDEALASGRSMGYGTDEGRRSALGVDSDILFQAPSDVDLPPTPPRPPTEDDSDSDNGSPVEAGGHRVNKHFEFPPRSPAAASPVRQRRPSPSAAPSSPESLSAAVQPDLAPIAPFSIRKTSLNVAAPEFVFGGNAAGRTSRSGSLASLSSAAGFGSPGHPGSLSASSPFFPDSPPKPSLNPVASEFKPPFELPPHAKDSIASFGSVAGWGDIGKPGSLAAESPRLRSETPHRPEPIRPHLNVLASEFQPPEPLLAAANPDNSTPQSFAPPRPFNFQLPADAPTLPQETVLAAPQPRRVSRGPLPPIPLTSVVPHNAAIKRQKVEASWMSGSSPITPLQRAVSAPNIAQRRPLPTPPSQTPRQHRRPWAFDADQQEGSLQHGTHSDLGNASLVSIDDPVPPQYAPVRPVPRVATSNRPFTLRPAASFSSDGRILGFQGVGFPSTVSKRRSPIPAFSTPNTSIDGGKRKDRQVSPARMGDPRVRKQSADDIALPSATRPRSRAIAIPQANGSRRSQDEEDHLFDNETLPLTPLTDASTGSLVEFSDDGINEEDEDDLPLRILEDIISKQFDGLRDELRSFRSASEHDLAKQEAVVDAFASRVELLLATSNLRSTDGSASLLTLVDEAQTRTERALLDAIDRLPTAGKSGHPSLPEASLLSVTAPMRPTTPAIDMHPAAAYGVFLDDLRATVQPLAKDPLDVEVLASKLASLVQPQLADILTRLPPQSHETANIVVDKLKGPLEGLAAAASIDPVLLSKALAADLRSTLTALLKDVVGTVEARMTGSGDPVGEKLLEHVKEGNAAVTASIAGLETKLRMLLEAQVKFAQSTSAGQEMQAALKSAMGQLGLDVTSRLDVAYSQLEERFKAHLASAPAPDSEAKLVDLENQLAKARNEHGKVRSEKAVLAERTESDRARYTAELTDLRAQLATRDEATKALEIEKAVAAQAAARLEDDLAASKAEVEQLKEEEIELKEKLVVEERMRAEQERIKQAQDVEIANLRRQLEEARTATERLEAEREEEKATVRERVALEEQAKKARQQEREEFAAAKGEIASLEKRLAALDDRLSTVHRAKAIQQQALAQANQRNTALKKEVAGAGRFRVQATQLEAACSSWKERFEEADQARAQLVEENDKYRQQFTSLEQGLETMKESVTKELDEASTRINALTEERDRLAQEKAELVEEKHKWTAFAASDLASHFRPSAADMSFSSPVPPQYYDPSFPSSAPSTPPARALAPGWTNTPVTPQAFAKPEILVAQHTGDSDSDESVAHTTLSPAPTVSGRSFVMSSDGWYSAA
ncbi:hypothetical protein JCM1840_007073 [Sporobolomyces johnsonii]